MNITPLVMEVVRLRAAAADARAIAAEIESAGEAERLIAHAKALEARANELNAIAVSAFDDVLAATYRRSLDPSMDSTGGEKRR